MVIIEFTTIDEFIEELRACAQRVGEKTVRWRMTMIPEQKEGVTHQVECWATAIHKGADGDQLFELGLVAGRNSAKAQDGTAAAEAMRQKLAEACDDLGLKLRAGKIEVY